ncbi:MAG TPA: glycosyltransferase family 4 protein [Actinomycetota bacterium]
MGSLVRIALTCPYAWDDPGGVQTHVRELAERLLAAGQAVTVLAPVRSEAAQAWVRPVGRPVDIPYNASNAPIDPRPWAMRQIADELRRFGPDVVHVHEPMSPSTSMWATLASPVPVVATFHSGATKSRLYDVASPVLRRVARRLAIRVAVSNAAAEFARSRIGGGFEIVPNGVDVERFATAEPADLGPGTKVLFVGRLDERKGFPTALAAFERLAGEFDDLRLVVVGDGPDRDAVQGVAPGVRERIRMLGVVPNIDLPPFSVASDLYLGTAVGGESFGVVLVESMAAGVPVIASDIPGYREVVRDGVDGVLVPPRDPIALADAAARVLRDPVLADRFRAAGRARAQMFDWSVVMAQLEGCYRRASDPRSRPEATPEADGRTEAGPPSIQ